MTTTVFEARPRKARRVAVAAAVLLVAVFAVVATLLRQTPTGVYFRLSDQVAMMLVGLLLAGAWKSATCSGLARCPGTWYSGCPFPTVPRGLALSFPTTSTSQ
jgi:hypothetical protein